MLTYKAPDLALSYALASVCMYMPIVKLTSLWLYWHIYTELIVTMRISASRNCASFDAVLIRNMIRAELSCMAAQN